MDLAKYLKARTVEDGDCLVWQLATNPSGQPIAMFNNKVKSVRRHVWEVAHNVPASKLRIVPKCRNPKCVNADHALALTTTRFNTWIAEGGSLQSPTARASRAANARTTSPLNIQQVREIRRRYAEGKTQTALGKEFGVSTSTISLICLNKSWPDPLADPFSQMKLGLLVRP